MSGQEEEITLPSILKDIPLNSLVKRYFIVAVAFLLIGGGVGFFMRWGLGLPSYAPFRAVFFFNLITVHPFLLLIGWVTTVLAGLVYFELPRLTGNKTIYSTKLALLQLYLMIAGLLLIGLSGSVNMFTSYPPLRNPPIVPIGGTLLIGAMGIFFLNVIKTVRNRPKDPNGRRPPVVTWYLLAGSIALFVGMILWAFVMTLGILFPDINPIFGKELTWLALRVYLQNGLLITVVGFLFLLTMRLWGMSELYSPGMALLELPLFIPLASFPAHWQHLLSDPVPMFMKLGGTLTAQLVLLTFVMSIFNIYLTRKHSKKSSPPSSMSNGNGDGLSNSIPKSNLKVVRSMLLITVVGYTLVCFTGAFQGTLPVNVIVHNTQWVAAHIHIVTLATLTMLGFTAIYYYLPQVTGRNFNPRLATIQIGIFLAGAYTMILSLMGAGLNGLELSSGMVRRVGITYNPIYWPFMFSALIGAMLLATGVAFFLFNFIRMLSVQKQS